MCRYSIAFPFEGICSQCHGSPLQIFRDTFASTKAINAVANCGKSSHSNTYQKRRIVIDSEEYCCENVT